MLSTISDLITVVTPAYNASTTIARSVGSVLKTLPDVPYIVVDDGSDSEHQYRFETYPSLLMLKNEVNLGGASSRNKGLALVRTPFVLFLDSDDYLLPDTLGTFEHIVTQASPDVIFFPWWKMNKHGALYGPYRLQDHEPVTIFMDWLSGRFVPPCAVVWRTEFIRSIGGWGEGLRYNDDMELALRAMLHQPTVSVATAGGGVYIKGVNPDAVSNADAETALVAQLRIIPMLADLVDDKVSASELRNGMKKALGEHLFIDTRRAYANGYNELANQALQLCRQLGYDDYVGGTVYRILAQTLGPMRAERVMVRSKKLLAIRYDA